PSSAYLSVLCVKRQLKRRGRRDTQRTAEKISKLRHHFEVAHRTTFQELWYSADLTKLFLKSEVESMRCIRIASTYLLACLSLILFLRAGSIAPISAANPDSNLIRVWTVGSPHTGALPRAVVPPELRQRAER